MTTLAQDIGYRVYQMRTTRGWTLQELATRAGVGKSHIWAIEQGRMAVTVTTLAKVAGALEVSMGVLLGGGG